MINGSCVVLGAVPQPSWKRCSSSSSIIFVLQAYGSTIQSSISETFAKNTLKLPRERSHLSSAAGESRVWTFGLRDTWLVFNVENVTRSNVKHTQREKQRAKRTLRNRCRYTIQRPGLHHDREKTTEGKEDGQPNCVRQTRSRNR